ncbi:ATP-binding protein [Paenibacillus aestuarii]|uniref:histidine kinase n=1 Tax=Paenibacillus aestuarii TaxID=516965 RepID=A0ABW0K959_9BACL|nr:ATP-binding protein [Paenibacillus aestuarii]
MDILRSKLKEELINKNPELIHDLFHRFLNLSSEFMCITSLQEGDIIFVNQAFLDRVGYGKDKALSSSVIDLNIWETANNRGPFIELLKKNGTIEGFEQSFRDKHGRVITYILSAELIKLFDVECILTSGRDISQKTSLEEFHHNQMVEELRQTVNAINSLIIKLKKRADGQLVYVLAEGKLAEQLGYTTLNSYGKTVNELFPGLMEIEGDYYKQALKGHTVNFEIKLGDRILYKTLSPYWEHNQITGIIGSAIDITEQKDLARLLQTSEISASLGQLALGVAHEIRNPLTSIKGFVHLLGEILDKNGIDKGKEYVDLIMTELTRINDLVSEMLWLRKPKDTQNPQETFAVSTMISEILPLVTVEANLKSIQIILDYDFTGLIMKGNSAVLKQVILNLCKNGIEAMNEGGILIISGASSGAMLTISIKDSGPGIPDEIKYQIFNPFFTTKPSGNGLGLFISKQIIHEVGGTLTLDSDTSGTTALISFLNHSFNQNS